MSLLPMAKPEVNVAPAMVDDAAVVIPLSMSNADKNLLAIFYLSVYAHLDTNTLAAFRPNAVTVVIVTLAVSVLTVSAFIVS